MARILSSLTEAEGSVFGDRNKQARDRRGLCKLLESDWEILKASHRQYIVVNSYRPRSAGPTHDPYAVPHIRAR